MKQPKVSVIVPVYNVEKYIEKSIISICVQDFSNYEIIIVNDGTKDDSMKIVDSVLSKYDIPYLIINQKNAGMSAARNAGLKVATGEYVCFIDSDDIMDKRYISKLYTLAKNEDQSVCFCDFEDVFETNRFGSSGYDQGNCIITRNDLLINFLKRKYKIHACALLINREMLINDNMFFNEDLRFGEDNNFMWRLFPKLTSIGYVKAPLYKYLRRENSVMTNQKASNFLIMKDILTQTSEGLSKQYERDIDIFNWLTGRILIGSLGTYANQSDYKTFKGLINALNCGNYIKKVLTFPDIRVVLLAAMFFANKRLFYFALRR